MKRIIVLKIWFYAVLVLCAYAPQVTAQDQAEQNTVDSLFDRLVISEEDDSLEAMPDDSGLENSTATQSAFDAYRQSLATQDDADIISPSLESLENSQQTAEDLEAEIRDEAFNAAVNGLLPLRPDEIRRFLEVYDEVKQASNTPVYPYPKPESKVQEVSLDPADKPSIIKLATGHVTTITLMDASGAPWPISSMSWAGDFEINPPEEGSATIRIIPMTDFAYGNIALTMSKLQTPVIFTLQAQRENVYVRYDAVIPENGPLARPAIMGSSGPKITAGSVDVVSVLDGTLPNEAISMNVEGADSRTRAYDMKGAVYLRTPHTLISPAWSQSASSADGMNVYVLKKTPVVLLSEKGKIIRAFLKDNTDDNNF